MSKSLHLEIIGKGRPLIMLHGWGWHSGIWQPLVSQLAENFQLFLIDLPGFGKSPLLSADYKIEHISAALLDLTPPEAIWAGWSLGGMIAWYIALHNPECVTHLVTIASSPKWVSTENWPGISPATLEKFSQLLMRDHQKTLQDFLELQLRGAPKNPELVETLQKQMVRSSHIVPALSGGLQLLRELDLRADLTKIQCPGLHLFGSHDTLVPVSIIEKIQPLLPQGTCSIIPRAGHIPFLSHPDIFLQRVRAFLS